MDLRSLQKPLKEQYRSDPNASQIRIRAKGGQTDVPVAFCLGLWRLARRSPVRWWLRLWAYQPNALRSPWRETWIFEAPLAYQKTCPSALRAFIFILMLLLLRQPRNNCADCAKRQSNIV